MKHTVLITGAAGYVGAMLVEQFAKRDDVDRIIGLDMEPVPEMLKSEPKLSWIRANTSDGSWQGKAAALSPDIVIHAAWQIRALYGRPKTTWKWNVDGSKAVFEFTLNNKNIRRLVHFSTAAVYGAFATNTFEHRFRENEPMLEKQYIYAVEKEKAEEDLDAVIAATKSDAVVAVIRPAAITGPRGRFMRIRFGLQSALSGQLKGGVYGLISALVSLVPATDGWVRQFIHEDDVVDIVAKLSFEPWKGGKKETYNLTPGGEPVYAPDMARAVGKGVLHVSPWMVHVAYFFFWHLTRGKVPTAPGSWRFYSYPIVMDGSKIETMLGFNYSAPSFEAFRSTKGRYESYVPKELRTS